MSQPHWVNPQAATTFTFSADLSEAQWRTLERYVLDYMLQEGFWPTTASRHSADCSTSVSVVTGAEWRGRFEGDVCTLIYQVVGEIAIGITYAR